MIIQPPNQYHVEFVNRWSIKPSPENDDLYGEIQHDEQMDALIESIERLGLEEPLIVSADGFLISGHRRFYACEYLDEPVIPVRRKEISRAEHIDQWHTILTEYNPQRIKSARSLLKESLLRYQDQPQQLLRRVNNPVLPATAEFTEVPGIKCVEPVGPRQLEFLEACVDVVFRLKAFWPLQVRQIHYQLLNDPPLTQVAKRSSMPPDHWRFRNNNKCYDRLTNLLVPARYHGHIPWDAIDDPTRPQFTNEGWFSLSEYIEREMQTFLCGFHRDRQYDQPKHIEVFGEKNTLLQILKPICHEYYVPLSIGRGVCSHPVWRDISSRFKRSGKERMTLIVLSDFDAAGFMLADDAVRSLRDLWGIPVDYHRVAVERRQIDELGISEDFNPEKAEGEPLRKFIERTGSSQSWELEALHPEYIQSELRKAIEANMDMDQYQATIQQEALDAKELAEVRRQLLD